MRVSLGPKSMGSFSKKVLWRVSLGETRVSLGPQVSWKPYVSLIKNFFGRVSLGETRVSLGSPSCQNRWKFFHTRFNNESHSSLIPVSLGSQFSWHHMVSWSGNFFGESHSSLTRVSLGSHSGFTPAKTDGNFSTQGFITSFIAFPPKIFRFLNTTCHAFYVLCFAFSLSITILNNSLVLCNTMLGSFRIRHLRENFRPGDEEIDLFKHLRNIGHPCLDGAVRFPVFQCAN